MKVAIIGCGVTGMSAGIALRKAGIDTVIYEKTDKPGGVIAVYQKNDVLINNALEFVLGTAQNTFANDMWQSLGVFKKTPKQVNCFLKFSCDNHFVGVYKDFDETVNELLSIGIGTQDKLRILRLSKAIKKFKKIEIPLITKGSSNIFKRLFHLLLNCFAVIPDVLYYSTINCKQYSKKFKSPGLKVFFSEALNDERRVIQYIALWSFFSSGNFGIPTGNQQEMVLSLYNNYIKCGGEVVFLSNLSDVVIKNEKICGLNFEDKTVHNFDYVIFSNDIASVNAIMKNSDKSFSILERAIKKEHIMSSCMLYFKLNVSDNITGIDNTSIPCPLFKVGTRYLDKLTVRIQPGADDHVISVTLYQNEKDFSEWKNLSDISREMYVQEKNNVAQSVAASIEERFPELRGKLQLCDMVTPLTYYRYTGVNCGGWMPESFNPLIYLFFGRGRMPGIKNATLAGQKVFPIGGTTLGAFSGIKAAEKVIKLSNHKNQ